MAYNEAILDVLIENIIFGFFVCFVTKVRDLLEGKFRGTRD